MNAIHKLSGIFLGGLMVLMLVTCSKVNTTITGYQLKVGAISPDTGSGSALVTVTGVGFSLVLVEDTVLFNGLAGVISQATDSSIQVYVPPGGTTGPVTVIVRDQQTTGPVFTYTAGGTVALVVTGIVPNHGKAGDTVTITGQGFDPDKTKDSVFINNSQAVVISATPTTLKVIVPAATTGNVYVYADSRFTRGPVFTYDVSASLSITGTSLAEGKFGDTVLIYGTGFSTDTGQDITTFNYVRATVVAATTTTLVTLVPRAAGTGNIRVTVGGQNATGPVFNYLYNIQVSTFAGGSQGRADGMGTQAQFYHPTGICFDSLGNLIVADCFNSLIRRIAPNGAVTTIAGGASSGFQDGNGTNALFSFPIGVCSNPDNSIVIGDASNNRVRLLSFFNNAVTTIAGNGGSANADGPALQASFVNPGFVARDGGGVVYVGGASSLFRVIRNDSVVTLFNGQNTTPVILDVYALVVDGSGNIIVGDGARRVYRVTPAGGVSVLAGSGTAGHDDGPALSATFNSTVGLAVDYHGNIIVADLGSYSIRMIGIDGNVTTIAGGTQGYIDGDVTLAEFQDPECVAVDKQGNIYVSEPGANRIRKITIE